MAKLASRSPRWMFSTCRVSIATVAIFWTACAPPEPAEQEEPAAKPQSEPAQDLVAMTSGQLDLAQVPQADVTAREVIIVSQIDPGTEARLIQQRALFEAKIERGSAAAPAATASPAYDPESGLGREDALKFTTRLRELHKAYPAPLETERDAGNLRLERFISDAELHKDFARDFGAITLENMQRAIPVINKRIMKTVDEIKARMDSLGEVRRIQAEVDTQWLRQLNEHLADYLPLAKEVARAQQIASNERSRQENEAENASWEAYMRAHSATLMAEVFQHSLGVAEVADDGTFAVEGHGILILRIEYAPLSAFFFPESPEETRVRIQEVAKYHAPR